MTAESDDCCNEYGCRRANPYRLRYSDLSKRWLLLTAYDVNGKAIVARTGGKHDVTEEVQNAVIAAVFTRLAKTFPPSDLDDIAEEFGLSRSDEVSHGN